MRARLTGDEILARDCATSFARAAAMHTILGRLDTQAGQTDTLAREREATARTIGAGLLTRVATPPLGYDLHVEARYPCRGPHPDGDCHHEDDPLDWTFPCTTVFEALELIRSQHGDGHVRGYGPVMDVTYVRLSTEAGAELFRWSEDMPFKLGELADEFEEEHSL